MFGRSSAAALFALFLSVGVNPVFALDLNVNATFAISPQPLATALIEFGRATNIQIMTASDDLQGIQAASVQGTMPIKTALNKLLTGTNLQYQEAGANSVAITKNQTTVLPSPREGGRAGDESSPGAAGVSPNPNSPLAPLSKVKSPSRLAQNEKTHNLKTEGDESKQTSEVVVTGTHLRGASGSASPIQIYNRDDIDRSGAGTVEGFVSRLPQNFSSASANTIAGIAGNAQVQNPIAGAGVDLRGLGANSTLTLINGRRVASGNVDGSFVDVSLIPLIAVERIEVVPDGASAIYGSDAVGGVINFILRRNFEGSETRVRYGSVSDGGFHEFSAGETLGTQWGEGSALLSYEYFDSSALDAQDRSYTNTLGTPSDLLPEQTRHSAFLSLSQLITPAVKLFSDTTFSQKDNEIVLTRRNQGFSFRTPTDIESLGTTLGSEIGLPGDTQLTVSASYGSSHTKFRQINIKTNDLDTDDRWKTSTFSLDAKFDGAFEILSAGPIRFAVGAQYRDESFSTESRLNSEEFKPDRSLAAAFMEFRIPIVGPREEGGAVSRLELSLAGRAERYSDFGSSTNPQVGIIWRANRAVNIRGSYGTSFKAPLLNDLNPLPDFITPIPQFDPTTGSDANVLVVTGGNPALQPEEARTWTFGVDLRPESLPGFSAAATFWNIRFTDRIIHPAGGSYDFLFNALGLEGLFGSEIVQRNPSQARVQELAALPAFDNSFFGIDLATIGAIADGRTRNFAAVNTRGIDLSVSYSTQMAFGEVEGGLDATRILKFDSQFTTLIPATSELNTPYNPVDLRLRARGSFSRGSLNVSVFVNYIDAYRNTRVTPIASVASWTTTDLTVNFESQSNSILFQDSSILLGIQNIADKDPPFVRNPSSVYPVNFDGSNANALGRFYSLQLTKRF